jgi:hypothetical protein
MRNVSFLQQSIPPPAAPTRRRVVDTEYFAALVGKEAADRLIRGAGLAAESAPLPQTLDMVTFWRLCAENIQARNDESHGVAAEPVACGSLSLLFMAANQADDLGAALQRLSEAISLIRKECRVRLVLGNTTVRFTLAPLAGSDLRAEIYVECMMIVTHCALRWMTGLPLVPLRVRGAAALQAMGGEILDALQAPVARRGEGVTLIYRRTDMNAPILQFRRHAATAGGSSRSCSDRWPHGLAGISRRPAFAAASGDGAGRECCDLAPAPRRGRVVLSPAFGRIPRKDTARSAGHATSGDRDRRSVGPFR